MKLFSGSSNRPLAERIAKELHVSLSSLEMFIFPDGERRIRIEENVVEEDTVIIQPTATPGDQNYMELFFIADGLRRSGARLLTAVIPYLGYQRQDHVFRDGEAVSLEVIVKTMEAVGIQKLISFDLHSIKIPEVFKIPVTHLSALPLFAKLIKEKKWDNTDTVLVSPDKGGIRRIKILSEMLGDLPYATIVKNRDLATGFVEAASIDGPIGKRMIMVDDMISSGSTMIKAAELLQSKGTEKVIAMATHPVFSSDAPNLLEDSQISKIYVTDTVYIPKEKYFSKLHMLSVAEMIATELKKGV